MKKIPETYPMGVLLLHECIHAYLIQIGHHFPLDVDLDHFHLEDEKQLKKSLGIKPIVKINFTAKEMVKNIENDHEYEGENENNFLEILRINNLADNLSKIFVIYVYYISKPSHVGFSDFFTTQFEYLCYCGAPERYSLFFLFSSC